MPRRRVDWTIRIGVSIVSVLVIMVVGLVVIGIHGVKRGPIDVVEMKEGEPVVTHKCRYIGLGLIQFLPQPC